MTLTGSVRIAGMVCAIARAQSGSYGASTARSRIYSNVEYNEEGETFSVTNSNFD